MKNFNKQTMNNPEMKEQDQNIKSILNKGMQKIDDDAFTKKVIEMHLAQKDRKETKPFLNFSFLVVGVSLVLLSVGFMFLIRYHQLSIDYYTLNEQHGFIIFSIAITFVLYKWLEEFMAPKTGQVKNGLEGFGKK